MSVPNSMNSSNYANFQEIEKLVTKRNQDGLMEEINKIHRSIHHDAKNQSKVVPNGLSVITLKKKMP